MRFSASSCQAESLIEIQSDQRWLIYLRLRDLGIPCWCKAYQPLRIQLDSPTAILQFQQVLRSVTASKQDLAGWLEDCWQLPN